MDSLSTRTIAGARRMPSLSSSQHEAIKTQDESLDLSVVGRQCGVTRCYVRKVCGEILCNDGEIIELINNPQDLRFWGFVSDGLRIEEAEVRQ